MVAVSARPWTIFITLTDLMAAGKCSTVDAGDADDLPGDGAEDARPPIEAAESERKSSHRQSGFS